MISNILGILEQRSPRRYTGKHRAHESGAVPRPRTAPEAKPPERPAREMLAAVPEAGAYGAGRGGGRAAGEMGGGAAAEASGLAAAATEVTMELRRVILPLRSATPPPR